MGGCFAAEPKNVNDKLPDDWTVIKIQNQEERMRGLYSSKTEIRHKNFYRNCEDGI